MKGRGSAPSSSLLLLVGLLLVLPAGAVGDEILGVGERRTLTLAAGDTAPAGLSAGRVVVFTPPADGPYTFTAESLAGDVILRQLVAEGDTPPEDDNGLFEWNARLVVPCRTGQVVRVLAAFKKRLGAVTVAIAAGDVPPPQGHELLLIRAEFRQALVDGGTYPENSLTGCETLLSSGEYFCLGGWFARGRGPLERAAKAAEHNDPLLALKARCCLAEVERQIGDATTAAGLLEAAVADAVALKQPALELVTRSNLGLALIDVGRVPEGEASLRLALGLAQEAGDVLHQTQITSQLALAADRAGRVAEAVESDARALELARKLGDAEVLAGVLLGQGSRLSQRGGRVQAEAALAEALALTHSPPTRGRILGELAGIELELADQASALRHYGEAAALGEQLDDSLLWAKARTGTGVVLRELGRLDEAEKELRAALDLYPPTGSMGPRTVAMLQLAAVLGENGHPEGELSLCEKALSGARSAGDVSAQLAALNSLSLCHEQSDRLQDALRFAGEAQELARKAGRLRELGAMTNAVAYLRLRLGSPAEARQLASEALATLRPLEEPGALLAALTTLAEAALALGDEPAARKALDESESILGRFDGGLEPELASAVRRRRSVSTCGQLAQDLAALHWSRATTDDQRRQAADEGLRAAGRWKGRALFEGLLLRLGAPSDALHELAAAGGGRLEPRASEGSATQAASSLLAPGDVLVEYTEGISRLYVWVTRDGATALQDLGPRAPLAAKVAEYVREIGVPTALADVAHVGTDGHALYQALLARPLAGSSDSARLFIVPSPAVATLPFDALVKTPVSAPKDFKDLCFVLDQHEVIYSPSTPVLGLLATSGPRATPGRALVLGDPTYPLPGAIDSARGQHVSRVSGLQRLPGTRDEALGVAKSLAAGKPDADAKLQPGAGEDVTLDTPQLRLCLGNRAAPAALREDASQFSLIHCAAHGSVDPYDPRRTGLALSPGAQDDGFLAVPDVLDLRLDADLAVLSACETGRGGERRGEGTQSLARAFLYAGARSVVSSLWQVDDHETERLMSSFYAGLARKGTTSSQALHAARLELRRAPATPDAFRGLGRGHRLAEPLPPGRPELAGHPFFWAAFIYVGPPDSHPLQALIEAAPVSAAEVSKDH